MRKAIVLAAAASAAAASAAAGTYQLVIRPWYERWGVDPEEAGRELPGDDIIPAPSGGETRGITIDAPPEAVWPWLVQMGYGRGGWYSYDRLDMRGKSSDRIVPAWQSIKVGETIPAYPGGGFEVADIQPNRALVLYLDDEIVERQRRLAEAAGEVEPTPAGLAASGSVMGAMPSRFRTTWTFFLDSVDGNRTRLIERSLVDVPDGGGLVSSAVMPLIGFGVFVMMRRQMLGLKERAERLAAQGVMLAPDVMPGAPADVGDTEAVPA
jgi:hypothetical protein